MTDDHFADSVASYVLGALPHEEVADFEAHLATCPSCRAEVQGLRPVADALAAAPLPAPAPPELRDRIMRTVEAEAQVLAAAGPEADERPARRGWLEWLRRRPALAVAGAAAVACAAVLGFVVGQGGGGPSVTTTPAKVTAQAGGRAVAYVERERGTLRLETRHWAGPGRGRVYQVWLNKGSGPPKPTPALFTVGADGSATVDLPKAARTASHVFVSSEPAGGSRTGVPSRTPVLATKL